LVTGPGLVQGYPVGGVRLKARSPGVWNGTWVGLVAWGKKLLEAARRAGGGGRED